MQVTSAGLCVTLEQLAVTHRLPHYMAVASLFVCVCVCAPACSVAQFTTDDIGLIWLTSSNQTTAALTYLRTLASNTSYGILGESSTLHLTHTLVAACCQC